MHRFCTFVCARRLLNERTCAAAVVMMMMMMMMMIMTMMLMMVMMTTKPRTIMKAYSLSYRFLDKSSNKTTSVGSGKEGPHQPGR